MSVVPFVFTAGHRKVINAAMAELAPEIIRSAMLFRDQMRARIASSSAESAQHPVMIDAAVATAIATAMIGIARCAAFEAGFRGSDIDTFVSSLAKRMEDDPTTMSMADTERGFRVRATSFDPSNGEHA